MPKAAHGDYGAASPNRWRRHHHPWLATDPDGYIRDFGYDIMRRSDGREQHDVVVWVARQLRMQSRHQAGVPLSHAVPCDDLVHQAFLVPDTAPSHMADAQHFWSALQAQNLGPTQHLWAGPTIWFPNAATWHVPAREVREFIQANVVDRLGTPAHLVVHDPGLIGKAGDLHIHVIIAAQRVNQRGFCGFVPELVSTGCQRRMWQNWTAR